MVQEPTMQEVQQMRKHLYVKELYEKAPLVTPEKVMQSFEQYLTRLKGVTEEWEKKIPEVYQLKNVLATRDARIYQLDLQLQSKDYQLMSCNDSFERRIGNKDRLIHDQQVILERMYKNYGIEDDEAAFWAAVHSGDFKTLAEIKRCPPTTAKPWLEAAPPEEESEEPNPALQHTDQTQAELGAAASSD
jgi:hypothetical protein